MGQQGEEAEQGTTQRCAGQGDTGGVEQVSPGQRGTLQGGGTEGMSNGCISPSYSHSGPALPQPHVLTVYVSYLSPTFSIHSDKLAFALNVWYVEEDVGKVHTQVWR